MRELSAVSRIPDSSPSRPSRRGRHFAALGILTAAIGTASTAAAGTGKIVAPYPIDAGKVTKGVIELEFSFRIPPLPKHVTVAREQMQRASQLLCDATDGQIRIGKVRFTVGGDRQEDGDNCGPPACRGPSLPTSSVTWP
jgi:hypothetical protein